MDDFIDEDDVFGHGGGLDQEEICGSGNGAATHSPEHDEGREDAERSSATAAPTPLIGGTSLPGSSGTARSSTACPRRMVVQRNARDRDYVAEAVARVGASLKRRDTDPQGRMLRLRRRITERAEMTIAEGRADAHVACQDDDTDEATSVIGGLADLRPPKRPRLTDPRDVAGTMGGRQEGISLLAPRHAAGHHPHRPARRPIWPQDGGHLHDPHPPCAVQGCDVLRRHKRMGPDESRDDVLSPRRARQRHGAGSPRAVGLDTHDSRDAADSTDHGRCSRSYCSHRASSREDPKGPRAKGVNGGVEAPSGAARGTRRGRSSQCPQLSPSPPRSRRRAGDRGSVEQQRPGRESHADQPEDAAGNAPACAVPTSDRETDGPPAAQHPSNGLLGNCQWARHGQIRSRTELIAQLRSQPCQGGQSSTCLRATIGGQRASSNHDAEGPGTSLGYRTPTPIHRAYARLHSAATGDDTAASDALPSARDASPTSGATDDTFAPPTGPVYSAATDAISAASDRRESEQLAAVVRSTPCTVLLRVPAAARGETAPLVSADGGGLPTSRRRIRGKQRPQQPAVGEQLTEPTDTWDTSTAAAQPQQLADFPARRSQALAGRPPD